MFRRHPIRDVAKVRKLLELQDGFDRILLQLVKVAHGLRDDSELGHAVREEHVLAIKVSRAELGHNELRVLANWCDHVEHAVCEEPHLLLVPVLRNELFPGADQQRLDLFRNALVAVGWIGLIWVGV